MRNKLGSKWARALVVLTGTAALLALPSTGEAVGPPPANDNFANAAAIESLPFAQTADNTLATAEPGEPHGCSGSVGLPAHTVWYRYQPAADTTLVLDTRGTDFQTTAIGVYTGASVDKLTPVKCLSSASAPNQRLAVPMTAGNVYAIQVGSQSAGITGRLRLNAYIGGGLAGAVLDEDGRPAEACVNVLDADERLVAGEFGTSEGVFEAADLPAGVYRVRTESCYAYDPDFAETAEVPVEVVAGAVTQVQVTVTHLGAVVGTVTTTGGAPVRGLCVVARTQDGRYKYTATDADGAYALYVGAGRYSVDVNCNGYDPRYSRQFLDAIDVGGPGTKAVFDAVVAQHLPPVNDDFADAAVETHDFIDIVELTLATSEPGEPRTCGNALSAWYKFTPDFTDTVTVNASGLWAAVGVYQGNAVDSLQELACHATWEEDAPAAMLLPVEAGQTYYFRLALQYRTDRNVAGLRVLRLRDGGQLTYDKATTPCGAACPYWTYGAHPTVTTDEAACEPEPLAPPGSWQDHPLTVPDDVDGQGPAFPEFSGLLLVQFDPELDFDGFVCRAESDEYGMRSVGNTADPLAGECAQRGDLGCKEEGVFRVRPGERLVLRIYNWAATGAVTVNYRYAG